MAQMIDRNGHRFGAGLSAVLLLFAFLLDWHGVVPAMAAALGIGAFLGPRYSPLGATYRAIKNAARLAIPADLEEQAPPRFAQLIGFVFLAAGTLAFWPAGNTAVGWALALVVAALQALLAATGLCVGCEMYVIGRRLLAKGAS